MNFNQRFLTMFIWIYASAAVVASPLSYATRLAIPSPEVGNFYSAPADQLAPGTEPTFIVEETPKGKAGVRIDGLQQAIALPEIKNGVYEGRYAITAGDRFTADRIVQAGLRVSDRSATKRRPLAASLPSHMASPVTAADAVTAGPLGIDGFSAAVDKIEAGADLRFTLLGTPDAKASFTIEGIAKDIPMKEVKSGRYEGAYTIGRFDNFPSGASVTGTLEKNGRTVHLQLKPALPAVAKPPAIRNVSPGEGEVVTDTRTVISGTFDDSPGAGIDARTVTMTLGGNDVTRSAIITPQFFAYRAVLKPGPYPVEIAARDASGNTIRYAWTFNVALETPVEAGGLPLEIVSHANNAEVAGSSITVSGRTAPDAKVDVQVQAFSALTGLGLAQQVVSQSVRADANGNFSFNFQPQVAVPGTRYELSVHAAKNDLRNESRLVLFQQK